MTDKEQADNAKNPLNLVSSFKSDAEFMAWCLSGEARDIDAAIKEFHKYDLLWHVTVMQYCRILLN